MLEICYQWYTGESFFVGTTYAETFNRKELWDTTVGLTSIASTLDMSYNWGPYITLRQILEQAPYVPPSQDQYWYYYKC